MEQHYSGKLLALAAIVAVAVSIGASTYNLTGCCRQNLAKAETVLRAQRWQKLAFVLWAFSYIRALQRGNLSR
jgi:hypothetical protein